MLKKDHVWSEVAKMGELYKGSSLSLKPNQRYD